MKGDYLGHLPCGDPLYGYLKHRIFPQLGSACRSGIRVFRTNGSNAVYIYEDINVIENRLYARELSVNPTPEKLSAFLARKEANIRDYRSLRELSNIFDSFLRNDELERCAHDVFNVFAGIISGKPVDREENSRIACELADSADAKQI